MTKSNLIYYTIPIVIQLVCVCFRNLEGRLFSYGTVIFIQTILNAIIIPIYLVIINFKKFANEKLKIIIIQSIMIVLVLSICIGIAIASSLIFVKKIDDVGWGIIKLMCLSAYSILIFSYSIAMIIKK